MFHTGLRYKISNILEVKQTISGIYTGILKKLNKNKRKGKNKHRTMAIKIPSKAIKM